MQPRIFIASRHPVERAALRAVLPELDSQIVGEASDWHAVLNNASCTMPDIIVVDWNVMSDAAVTAISSLRQVCPPALLIVIVSRLEMCQQEMSGAGADVVVNKDESAEDAVEKLRGAIALCTAPG